MSLPAPAVLAAADPSSAWATTSDSLYGLAVVLYTAALLAAALSWSHARPTALAVPERRLVGVGAPPSPAEHAPPAASRPDATAGTALRERWAGNASLALAGLAAAVHLGSLVARGAAAGRVPWASMYEFTSAATFAVVATFLVLRLRGEARGLAPFVLLPVVVALCVGASLYVPVGELQPSLDSYWLVIHVAAAVLATGVFTVGGVAAVLVLVRGRWEERATAALGAGRPTPRGLGARLPGARGLDALSYRANAFGFVVWTLAVLLGAVWAREAWTRAWGWDPKETWAFVSWVLYAAYLHARTTPAWRGRRATVLGLVALGSILFNYFAVNLLFPGLHSYSGL